MCCPSGTSSRKTYRIDDHWFDRLLDQYGYERADAKTYYMEYRAGTPEGELVMRRMTFLSNGASIILKWGCATKDYDALYRQAQRDAPACFSRNRKPTHCLGSKAQNKIIRAQAVD